MNEVKLQSAIYKLYELRAQFIQTIDNIKKINAESQLLIDIINESDKKEGLSESFIEGLKENIEHNNSQLEQIATRLSYADKVIKDYEKQDDNARIIDEAITLAFEAIGLHSEDEPVDSQEVVE